MRCPICNQLVSSPEARPFCSARCRQIDLARWLDGSYSIADDSLTSSTMPDACIGGDDIARSKEPLCD